MYESSEFSAPINRLEALPGLLGHETYVDSLKKIGECMIMLATHPGANISMSPRRIKNMLAAMVVHLRGHRDCRGCAALAARLGLRTVEDDFLAACSAYSASTHAKTCSSLAKLSVLVPASGGVSAAELLLLPEYVRLLGEKFKAATV